jgi:formamidopyrimidine-DNA glycosylase
MPELPEVETVVRDIRPQIVGRRIARVELGRRQPLKTPPRKIVELLEGAAIESVERWGKNIVIRATRPEGDKNGGGVWWLIHLGMSGRLVVEPASEERRPHTHGVFALDSGESEGGLRLHGAGDIELRYSDPRMFGRIEVSRDIPARLKKLGPEPLEIGAAEFVASLRRRRARLKALLLDQSFVRGVGNIYADESLFRASLDPRALGSRVPPARAADLHRALQAILRDAIESKGSSVRTYLYGQGESGSYQYEHLVYGRAGEACTRCKKKLKTAIVAGRTTVWCPKCQRRR